jgi:DnaJ-class molecular chaperone
MPAVQFKDYYKILGVSRAADEKAIRNAYRTLARKYHPDVNPGDKAAEERFKEVNEAHEVLSDPAKRKMYDRFGDDWQRYRDAGFTGSEPRSGHAADTDPMDFTQWFTGHAGNARGGTRVEFGGDAGGFSDFFQTLFGARASRRATPNGRRPTRHRGRDTEVSVELSFNEAFRGVTKRFDIQNDETCPMCQGTGLVREAMCPTCDGAGHVSKSKTIEVKIPAGVETGSRIRVKGQGSEGDAGGPRGDVYLRITIRPSSQFERIGDDLRTDVDVPLYTALLGGEVIVPTPTSQLALIIPTGTQPGRQFRLRGQGMPHLKEDDGTRGDLLVRITVVLPEKLTKEERALVEQLRDLRDKPSQRQAPSENRV